LIHSRADYGGHAALKEAEGGCRGKSLLNLIQVYLPYVPIGPWSRRPCYAEASTKTGAEPQAWTFKKLSLFA